LNLKKTRLFCACTQKSVIPPFSVYFREIKHETDLASAVPKAVDMVLLLYIEEKYVFSENEKMWIINALKRPNE